MASEVGRMHDVVVEDGEVCRMNLSPEQREQFQRLFMEAERQAEAWAADRG